MPLALVMLCPRVFHYMANAPKVECQTDNSLFYKTNYEHNERDVV